MILCGDVLWRLGDLPDESVHCVVTSPPYWGLRDYGVEDQIGLETTPEEYVARLVEVFQEVKRVLRKDGTCFVNLGDSYARDPKKSGSGPNGKRDFILDYGRARKILAQIDSFSLKPKDLVGIPWRVAFALQADSWWLRQDIIWAKPNPMPESVRDRCTKAHEYVFLLTKSAKYYWNQEASKEPSKRPGEFPGGDYAGRKADSLVNSGWLNKTGVPEMKNPRDVWTIATQGFPEAHFATFPEELVRKCLTAGCPPDGTVLDPFGGAGTTALVAEKLGMKSIMIELNPDYCAMAERRLKGATQNEQ